MGGRGNSPPVISGLVFCRKNYDDSLGRKDWKYNSERLASLGIMEAQLRASLNPL